MFIERMNRSLWSARVVTGCAGWRATGRLPPHLSHLQDVYERLPDPHGHATTSGPAAHPWAPAAPETLHGAQAAPRVILHEPPEAQDLDQHRRHQHEEQCESEPEVVLLDVVVEREPQVGAHVPEEDEEREDDPQAVQPQALLAWCPPDVSPLAQEVTQTAAPTAPVARRGVAAVADVEGAALPRVVLAAPHRLVQVVQLGETGDDPPTVGFRCHLALRSAHLRFPRLLTSLPRHLFLQSTPNEVAMELWGDGDAREAEHPPAALRTAKSALI